jgi:hypothetical protein
MQEQNRGSSVFQFVVFCVMANLVVLVLQYKRLSKLKGAAIHLQIYEPKTKRSAFSFLLFNCKHEKAYLTVL